MTELKRAANVVEWVTHPEFLGLEHPLWPAQLKALVDLFQDECWHCSEYLARQYVRAGKFEEPFQRESYVPYFQHGKCVTCGHTKQSAHPIPIREFIGAWGQRSGKGWFTAVAATYQLHKALTRGDLAEYFGLPSSAQFEFAFVDPSKKYVWPTFLHLWERSPWRHMAEGTFSRFMEDDEIYYPRQKVRVCVRDADDDCRGQTRLFGTIDEYDYARHFKVDAPAVRKAILNSFVTVETRLKTISDPDLLTPKLVLPSTPNRKSKDLALLCRTKRNGRLVSQLPTWAVNPEESAEALIAEFGDSDQFRFDFAAEVPEL